MKLNLLALLQISLIFVSQQAKADVQEIYVTGTNQIYNEAFDLGTYQKVDKALVYNGPQFSYDWLMPAPLPNPSYKSMVHESGTHFIAANYYGTDAQKQKWGSSGLLWRSMKFTISGRDFGKTYKIVSSQNFNIKSPDFGKKTSASIAIRCAADPKGVAPINNSSAGTWDQENVGARWFDDITITTTVRIKPSDCPTNIFDVRFTGMAQDLILNNLEVMALEETSL